MLKLFSFVTAVIIWWLLSLTLPPEIFPGPIETARALWGEIAGGRVGTDVAMTMLRVVGGLLLALVLGVPVGIVMGLNRRVEAVLDVWVMIGLTVPSLCYAIMAFMWFGLNEGAAIIAIGSPPLPRSQSTSGRA
jgi:NitT/TauT family transport system permease protein